MADKVSTERVIIVGAGLGALYAALALAPRPVLMISPEELGEGASSAWAQGGVAAAMDSADSPEAHARDTISAGAGTVDVDVAAKVTNDARAHILNLTDLGTPFDRGAGGAYLLNREAAHSMARVVRVKGDQAGRQIMETLIAAVRQTPSVQVLEGMMASGLEVSNGDVSGVWVQSSDDERSAPVLLQGVGYLMAGGGSGGLFALTTNPPRIRGQVIGMAARAGAVIADAEFVQFHPTAVDIGEDPAPLATEALRGEGAVLINKHGDRFMTSVHPDAELAPRDIVARAIFSETQAGNCPMLDTRDALGDSVLEDFPAVVEACARVGIDPSKDPIPVAAAAHYHMGGIDTAEDGRASLGNLWVCGEASSTGLHGANRLASNGLLEALVFARTCANSISDVIGAVYRSDVPEVSFDMKAGGVKPDAAAVLALRNTMTDHVGVVRTRDGLKTALRAIDDIELANAHSDAMLNMTATATMIAAAALIREESRGGHYRSDFPEANPGMAFRKKMTLKDAMDIRAQVVEEKP